MSFVPFVVSLVFSAFSAARPFRSVYLEFVELQGGGSGGVKPGGRAAGLSAGTYFYQLKYRFKGKDKVEVISGSINLIR